MRHQLLAAVPDHGVADGQISGGLFTATTWGGRYAILRRACWIVADVRLAAGTIIVIAEAIRAIAEAIGISTVPDGEPTPTSRLRRVGPVD